MTCGGLTRSTAAVKGGSPHYAETLEFFFVAPQVQDEDTCIELEVRDISFLDDVKVRSVGMHIGLLPGAGGCVCLKHCISKRCSATARITTLPGEPSRPCAVCNWS